MKKVLVTGAAGSIGLNVIKYLLMEGKYEITALDLNNKRSIKKLKKYKDRINIIYGDILDAILMESLVKEHDYIIHLAGLVPPLGDFHKALGDLVEYKGTENIVNTIKDVNENCYLIYASTTSVYDFSLGASIQEKIKESTLDNFSLNKYKAEKLIAKNLKNYTIFRIPLVLSNLKDDPFIYGIKKNLVVEVTTKEDAAYAFVKSLDYSKKLNKKIFNVGMGEDGRVIYNDILKNILQYYGLSWKYVLSRLFIEKKYNSPVLTDSDELDNLIHYRTDSLYNYYRRLKSRGKKRIISKIMAKPLLLLKK